MRSLLQSQTSPYIRINLQSMDSVQWMTCKRWNILHPESLVNYSTLNMLCNITPDHETCKGGSIVGSECLLFWRLNLHLLKVPILFSSCHSSVRLIQF